MSLYNVEVFDRSSFACVYHDAVERPEYRIDYLSPVDNTLEVLRTDALQEGQLLRITGADYDFFGVITSVGNDTEGITTIYYRDFLSVLAVPVLFDTDLQGSQSLEQTIADYITGTFISNADTAQNIEGLSVTASTSTTFSFNLKSDTDGSHYCIVDLYEALIAPALSKYGIVVRVDADPQAKTIELTVRSVADTVTIEADLPNVFDCRVTVAETSNNVNKLVIYNQDDFTQTAVYYLHSDGSYDTDSSTDRVTPVSLDIDVITVGSGETFAESAAARAEEAFGSIDISNLIEVDMAGSDALIQPASRMIGERTTIIKAGKAYSSILTGKAVGQCTTLIYGAMRLDITDLIRKGVK